MPSTAALDASAITLHHAGHGPPLVLLHCLGVDRHFWNFCADLTRDFTLLRYDLPGHGEAAVPASPYRVEEIMQMNLKGADCLLQQEHHHVLKGQLSATREVFVPTAMPLLEGLVFYELSDGFHHGLFNRYSI